MHLSKPRYAVSRVQQPPALDAGWDDPAWNHIASLQVAQFHPASSDHRPRTEAKLVHDGTALSGIFRVEDHYVVCVNTEYQSPVYKDSCIEFFVQPRASQGYFNFEMNCCGALLLQFVEDPRRTPEGFAKFTKLPGDVAEKVQIRAAFNAPIPHEIADSVKWTLAFRIPLEVMERYVGRLDKLAGQEWRANLHKCADGSSHPHWGAWAPLGEKLDFHNPAQFGVLYFE